MHCLDLVLVEFIQHLNAFFLKTELRDGAPIHVLFVFLSGVTVGVQKLFQSQFRNIHSPCLVMPDGRFRAVNF